MASWELEARAEELQSAHTALHRSRPMTRMRRAYWRVLLVVALAGTWGAAWTPAPAAAACAAPTIQLEPVVVAPGDQVTVVGRDFFVGCDDTAAPGEPFPERPGPADTNIRLVFVQNGAEQPLQVVAADESAQFTERVTVPASSSRGEAVIRAIAANGSPEASFTIAPSDGNGADDGVPSQQMSELPETGRPWQGVALVGLTALFAGVGLSVSRALLRRL